MAPTLGPQANDAETAVRRRKRNHLSREIIVAEAVEMLKEGAPDALTLRGLAKRLGVGAMSLYTHFASRDALLNGVADHVFALFEPPEPHGPWQDYIRNWLWATHRLFERFPVAPTVISWEGRVCTAWLKTWFPIASLLREQGLDGQEVAFAMDWFSTGAMSFIASQAGAVSTRQPSALAFVGELEPAEQRLAIELWSEFRNVDSRQVLAFGFEQYVTGLEMLVRNARARPLAKTASR
jgi:AcrR family transcriptional regulator